MSFSGILEFKKENLKEFHYLIKGLLPLSNILSKVDSDIWEYVHQCLGDRRDWGEHCKSFSSYDKIKFEFFMDKIVVHLANIEGTSGYTIECDDEIDSWDYRSNFQFDYAVVVIDLLSGKLIDMFNKEWSINDQENRIGWKERTYDEDEYMLETYEFEVAEEDIIYELRKSSTE